MKDIRKISILMILIVTIVNIPIFSQQVTKVLISGLGGQHDLDVKTAFQQGYSSYNGTNFTGNIDLFYDSGFDGRNSFIYAEANGYNVIVRSTSGLASVINQAANYPSISIFMPAGSNSFLKVYSGSVDASPVIITGAGDVQNETGYSVEFFSVDPINIEPDLSSYANGYLAGQICYLANTTSKTVPQARTLARATSSNRGALDEYDGYGQIDFASAFGALPVELTEFTAILNESLVGLAWQTATEVNNYGFNLERKSEKDDWKQIGFIQGSGTTNSPKNYNFSDSDLPLSAEVSYRLKQMDNDGTFTYSKVVTVDLSTVTGIKDEDKEYAFILEQNYPNPFNPSTTIKFAIPQSGHVTLKVYNLLGEEISELLNKEIIAGQHEVTFEGGKLTSGIYIYKLSSGQNTLINKMLLVK